jgi:phospholipase/carboxylesterase
MMSDLMKLDGPRVAPAAGGNATSLVILLHGVGADGNDLIGLAPTFARVLPHAAFVSPNAPYRFDMAPFGYQWFSIQVQDPTLRLAQTRQTAQVLNAFIDDELARHGLADDRLALVGFSQGTMMSLHVAPRRAKPCAGVMGYSGRLDSAELLAAETVSRPPIVLVHGAADELLPAGLLDQAAAGLKAAGFAVETHLRPGLGHGIDQIGLEIGAKFLARVLSGR